MDIDENIESITNKPCEKVNLDVSMEVETLEWTKSDKENKENIPVVKKDEQLDKYPRFGIAKTWSKIAIKL